MRVLGTSYMTTNGLCSRVYVALKTIIYPSSDRPVNSHSANKEEEASSEGNLCVSLSPSPLSHIEIRLVKCSSSVRQLGCVEMIIECTALHTLQQI